MNKNYTKDLVIHGGYFLILFVCPLAGILISGDSIYPYLQFPPQTTEGEPVSFSWMAFTVMLLFVVVTTWPFWKRLGRGGWKIPYSGSRKFPWWGWPAAAGMFCFWVLAWTRFSWFEPFQRYTFFPLWFCFVITLNALAQWIKGQSLVTRFPLYFTLLFPASAVFWWVFEYLNRFVNNWYYIGASGLSSWQYFWEATLPFSTVLPAVMSVFYILIQMPVFKSEYDNFPPTPWLNSHKLWSALGLLSIVGLTGTGWKPDYTFPLLWIAPGILWISMQVWKGYQNPVLKAAANGDLTLVWVSAVSALACGFFWEMWNIFSEAKWEYNVPGVERFYLFEMPALGYAGYLPFGVICLLISHSLFVTLRPGESMIDDQII